MKKYKRYKVRCIETEEVFESAAAAAHSVNRGRSAMCNHLNGRFPDLAGKTFERIEDDDE
ncbi:MAG: hypothetical protein CMC15_18620 [Flavobacteriaceae bacterium]|nr:hypothetical protein [Flavobacteriaceae bacterium]|tara:strand:- start:42 stop:221 length:180 start_codon:yes stop_codon:yes gene_type:complete